MGRMVLLPSNHNDNQGLDATLDATLERNI